MNRRSEMDRRQEFEEARRQVEQALEGYFRQDVPQKGLLEAMRYCLLAGGKRVRPVLVLKFCQACGGRKEAALPAACGMEMLHTYSLIHDDLPCMDDDDLRRGRPTCHRVYGQANAVLAGDALQAAAFEAVLSVRPPEAAAVAAACLARAAGEQGMCAGQYLDLLGPGAQTPQEDLRRIHALKTGALLKAACRMGVECAQGTTAQRRAAEEYAEALGMAFQIRDDMLDRSSTPEVLGKDVGSDEAGGKITFASLLGMDACARLVAEYTAQAKNALRDAFLDTGFLEWLADELAVRTK